MFKKRMLNLLKKSRNKFEEFLEINHEIVADESLDDIYNEVLTSILLQSLSKNQRYIITMKFMYHLSDKDIAKRLGISRQAVNRTKNRALNNLRKFLIESSGG